MSKILIFGNSGSGKSTLARRYADDPGLNHLDLDTIAWEESGVRKSAADSTAELQAFIDAHDSWVIEGCYGTLIEEASNSASELIFLNLPVEACLKNCRERPWEPHKYETREDQDRNLEMLLSWVAEYETRTGEFSLKAHREIFETFKGKKRELKSNMESQKVAEASTS
ncbi:MAG: hypothetical protein P1U58_03805 [Verrucomicrobiales bacterium]|nr:hypothetical protein [Verrucomicrobiales bacterium]